ncbi:flagellar M-ring protein FliF [Pseudomonas sp. L-22-4S-12]|uniref:flagellar basal-body MS-ring/collar protein FliF n=1 Tax=Pseudomonas sp. L-22-4S-12 TaxID=2610893 RepID=UPI0013239805|nr:flagellar M-ring protein FliF [Pseudomonas sp. L-22-4S-12]
MLQAIRNKIPLPEGLTGPRLTLIGLALLAAVLAAGVVYYLWRDQGALRPLYGSGESFPAAEVMQVLDAEAIPYSLHPDSGQVLVAEQQLSRARLLLAAKGVKVAVPSGYELFDKDEPLGASQFVQDVRLKRSLEGELARTIMAMKGIQQARVHLALEESRSFVVSQRSPGKASVMVQLAPGAKLSPEQIGAIVSLVAGSVPQLAAEQVSVVDQNGSQLSRSLHGWEGVVQNGQVVDDYRQKIEAGIEQVLAPVLGNGNYRISVAADFDFSQREETLQTYGDDPRVRNEVLRDESTLDELALGVPGSLSNRPPPQPQDPAQAADPAQAQAAPNDPLAPQNKAATSLRKESNRQLDYDQSVTHVKHAPYSLRQQSISVVLNEAAAPEGGWTPAARAELERSIKSAAGFNDKRGDVLSLSVFPFVVEAPLDLPPLPWWENSKVHDLVRIGVFGLICLLLLLLVIRPAVRNLTRGPQAELLPPADPAATAQLERQAHDERLLARVAEESRVMGLFSELNPLSEIRLPAPGSGLEHQIEHLQMLARNDPERVSEVIKQWIGRNERAANPSA